MPNTITKQSDITATIPNCWYQTSNDLVIEKTLDSAIVKKSTHTTAEDICSKFIYTLHSFSAMIFGLFLFNSSFPFNLKSTSHLCHSGSLHDTQKFVLQ
jgi:hypothetical protein